MNLVRREIYFMFSLAFLQGQYIIVVMPVKFVDQVFSSQHITDIPDCKASGKMRLYSCSANLPYRNFLHDNMMALCEYGPVVIKLTEILWRQK